MTKGLVTNGGIGPLKMATGVMATTVYERENIGDGASWSFSVRATCEGTYASYKTIS